MLDRSEFWRGVRDVSPFLIGALPFGMIAGIAAVNVGFPAALAIINSAAVFAGTAQLASYQLVSAGATLLVIWITTFFVNIRMLMYSATLAPYFRTTPRLWRLIMAFMLTDQAFAFSTVRFQEEGSLPEPLKRAYYVGICLPVLLVWNGASIVGALLGAQIPPSWSLDFVIPISFLALIVPNIRDWPTCTAAIVASLLAVILADLPLNAGLLLGIMAGMMAGRAGEALFHHRS